MGPLTKGFHFLGVNFKATQTPQRKIHVELDLHKRTTERGRSKAICRSYAVNPDNTRKYLRSWSTWWSNVLRCSEAKRSPRYLLKQLSRDALSAKARALARGRMDCVYPILRIEPVLAALVKP